MGGGKWKGEDGRGFIDALKGSQTIYSTCHSHGSGEWV